MVVDSPRPVRLSDRFGVTHVRWIARENRGPRHGCAPRRPTDLARVPQRCYDCRHGCVEPTNPDGGDGDESPSTGFLPISLALALLVTGMFFVPGLVRCDATPAEVAAPGH
jgi:hypothetical protein